MKIVITGSSNKFAREIYEYAEKLRKEGNYVVDDEAFHVLPENEGRCEFIKRICDCDKLLVFNKEGYIGFHTQFEIILAEIIGKEVEYIFPSGRVSQ